MNTNVKSFLFALYSRCTFHYNDVIMTTMASKITSLTIVYSTVYSDAEKGKHQSSASLAFVWGIHRDRGFPRTKGQLRGKCFHLMTSSWWQCERGIESAQIWIRIEFISVPIVVPSHCRRPNATRMRRYVYSFLHFYSLYNYEWWRI